MVKFHGENPGKGDTGFVRNIAGYVQLAAERARGLAGSLRTCGTEVGESWRGDAHTAWDGHLTAQAAVVEALAPQWETISTALTTYADAVEDIHARGEGFRDTIDADLASAASQGLSVTCYPDSVDMRGVTVRVPKETGPVEDPAGRMAKEAEASRLQSSINGELAKFWALEEERDTANSAVTSAISTNLPAGWETLKATYPTGTDPRTMLPAVPKEFYGYDGIDAAKELGTMLDPDSRKVSDEAWKFLEEHKDDPFFREHATSILGPEKTILLGYSALIDAQLHDRKTHLTWMQGLFAAGSPPASYDTDWMAKADDAIGPVGYAPEIVANLLGDGSGWVPLQLAIVSNAALFGKDGQYDKPPMYGRIHDDYAQLVYESLGQNAEAAALAFAGNHEGHFNSTLNNHSHSWQFTEAYASFLKAATVTATGSLADSNSSFVINSFEGKTGDQRYPEAIREVFGDIAVKYWDDYGNAIIARWDLAENPCRPGVEVNFDPWQNFLLEGMRDTAVAEKVTQQFVIWDARGFDGSVISVMGTDGTYSTQDEDGVYLERSRSMLIDEARKALYGQLIHEGQIKQDEINAQIDKAIGFVVNAAFDPSGTATDLLKGTFGVAFEGDSLSGDIDTDASKDAMRDILSGKTGEWAGSLVEYKNEDIDKFRDLRGKVVGASDDWEEKARETIDENQWIPPVRVETVVNGPDKQPVVTESHDWTGRPEDYEREASAEVARQGEYGRSIRFTETLPNGQVVLRDVETMKQSDPRAYQAYLNWLQDPAVQAKMSSVDPFRGYHRPSGG